ncbi:MAG: protein kinase [Pirellulales bacterium]
MAVHRKAQGRELITHPFAIKVFNPAFAEGGEIHLTRFFQEASILFQLNHPNIIRIHGVGLAGRRPYMVMDYFKGMNLMKAMAR